MHGTGRAYEFLHSETKDFVSIPYRHTNSQYSSYLLFGISKGSDMKRKKIQNFLCLFNYFYYSFIETSRKQRIQVLLQWNVFFFDRFLFCVCIGIHIYVLAFGPDCQQKALKAPNTNANTIFVLSSIWNWPSCENFVIVIIWNLESITALFSYITFRDVRLLLVKKKKKKLHWENSSLKILACRFFLLLSFLMPFNKMEVVCSMWEWKIMG